MTILEGLDGLRQLPAGSVLSVGNFDGVHRGHAEILRCARTLRDATPGAGATMAVVTFEPHPLTVLRPDAVPPRLSTPEMKRQLIAEAGADALVVLAPKPEVLNLAAEDFWAILRDEVRPAHMVEGESFNFGKGRRGTIARLREWSAASDVQLHVVSPLAVPLVDMQLAPVSSSLVRWLLSQGRVRDAGICLGRAYALEGQVVEGYRRGRTIGVPTANLDCRDQMIPADGVYAGRCTAGGWIYPVALSIGTMPTFEGKNPRQVEAHLIGFTGDLYGKTLRVELSDWVRDQLKFDGVEALKEQMARDIDYCAERAGVDAGRAIVQMSP
jgi:riboflavin kinase/FMN adenylyltransferase